MRGGINNPLYSLNSKLRVIFVCDKFSRIFPISEKVFHITIYSKSSLKDMKN